MHDQLSLPVDRKLQNSLILSMKSSIEERIRQASVVILQFLYTHFHRDHREQQTQRRRASTTTLEAHTPLSRKSSSESNANTEKNSSVKVSALVAHYSSSDSSAIAATNVRLNCLEHEKRCLPKKVSVRRSSQASNCNKTQILVHIRVKMRFRWLAEMRSNCLRLPAVTLTWSPS